jgi:hypothetical protein
VPQNLYRPPSTYTLPVSWHADVLVDFQNCDPEDSDTPVAYGAGVSCYLDVKTSTPQRFTAEMDDHHAVIKIESSVADLFADRTEWVFLVAYPTSPSTEVPVVNGTIRRYDGKRSGSAPRNGVVLVAAVAGEPVVLAAVPGGPLPAAIDGGAPDSSDSNGIDGGAP